MARPKLGEGKTERLHMLISEEELTAIDDWRFANRAPTRAEAIRRLIKMGLTASNWAVMPESVLDDLSSLGASICFDRGLGLSIGEDVGI